MAARDMLSDMRVLTLALALLALVGHAHAQPAPVPGAPAALSAQSAAEGAPRDYLAEVRANFTPENRAYASARVALGFIEPFYMVLVSAILLFTGLSARMRDLAHALGGRRYARVLAYLVLYSAVGFVLALPLLWYEGFALEHRYGLSNQSLGAWLGEQGKIVMFEVLFLGVIPILALAYRSVERHPRSWWLRLGAWSLPLITALVLIDPLVIEPAFNQFTPLADQHLKGRILALAERAGVPARKVYQVDRSAQTNKYNAYVSGFGPSQRVVLWDTTLRGMTEDEILFVTGHEIGHYRLLHIWKGIVVFSGTSLIVLLLTWLAATPLARRFGPRWGFGSLHDVASVPLLAALLDLSVFLIQPATMAFSRRIEHEADIFALELTHANDAGARAFIKLGSQNRSDPEPSRWVEFFEYSHPPLAERVRFAIEYCPWEQGRPGRLYREDRRRGAIQGPIRVTVRHAGPATEAASLMAGSRVPKRGA